MSKVKAIISLLLVVGAFICATVAFSSYWYQTSIKNNYLIVYKYNEYKYFTISGGDVVSTKHHTYTENEKRVSKNQLSIMNASLAFDILAWILFLITSILLIMKLTGVINKIPTFIPIISMIGKFILIGATLFMLLSMFIFLGIGSAKKRDCLHLKNETSCSNDNYDFVYRKNGLYQGPSTSWIAVVIGSVLSIAAMVINFFGVFEVTPSN
ncbi:hypothetical protein RB653_009638 [Dictyostelium firmibasis]|uniref:Uncharacterized protein n=1 Tax=Dictyostelium firmibasis TaxID=79012 RepID=A0AAN7YQC1_9MYCE